MKTKTVKQWLNTLPKELRVEALINASQLSLETNTHSLSQAVFYSYLWFNNPFWEGFYRTMLWAELLDNPPKKLKSIFNP